MAGKTFPGIGDLEDEAPPFDPAVAADGDSGNSRPFYSGPTVVDDVKVEEGLKKLRSLDTPLGGLTGITKAVVDAIESAPISAPIEVGPPAPRPPGPSTPSQVVANQMRETAVGRNVVGPTVGQQEIPAPFDDRALRGTLFGHSIHAPEFALPAPEEPPAPGALALLNRNAPTTTVAVYQPQATIPPEAEPFQRSNRYRDDTPNRPTPLTPIEVEESLPRKRVMKRVVIGAVAFAAIVGVALVWTRTGDDSEGSSASTNKPPSTTTTAASTPPAAPAATAPAATPPPVAAPPAAAPPAAAARESEPEPIPAAEPQPAHRSPPVAQPSARHSDPSPEPAAEEPYPAAHPHHTHATASHVDRHHATPATDKTDKTDKTDRNPATETSPAPSKPIRSGKRAPEDDPDATMAPSIE